MLVSVGIGFEAYKQFSVPVLMTSIGFAVVAILLFIRSDWAIPANIIFSLFLISLGAFIWYRLGRPGYMGGAVLCLACTLLFRNEIRQQK